MLEIKSPRNLMPPHIKLPKTATAYRPTFEIMQIELDLYFPHTFVPLEGNSSVNTVEP